MIDYTGHSFGQYHLLRLLGRGAQASVYLGEHRYLEIPAAIKILHVQMQSKAHERFLQEARTIARLQHPHIVRILDFGFHDQTPFLVMEYTPNGSLRTRHPRGTRLSTEQIITYVQQIAAALHYAHQQHVIHRDVKPDNILVNAHWQLVLSDFGLSVVHDPLKSLSLQDEAGTPLYMAPEQARRHPCAASDQYALGVMTYEWFCGHPPFQGSIYEVLSQHLYRDPASLCAQVSDLPPAAEAVVLKALAKDPAQRFADVHDFALALEETCRVTLPPGQIVGESLPVSPRPISTPPAALADTIPLPEPQGSPGGIAGPAATSARLIRASASPLNRTRLLHRVRAFWITGVLERSLHGAALIALGLHEHPEAVNNPWNLVLQSPTMLPQPLPGGTSIAEVYDRAGSELLILGAQGSGKTTLLLELARTLLARAEQEVSHPVPVVFNLSSWAFKQLPLAAWLTEELQGKYQVPRKLAQSLIAAEQILPMLDGLDEVTPKARTACIEAINSFRQEHGLLPLVVCSRSADYLEQTTRVQLGTAVMVQPLTDQQVDAYLASGGEALRAVQLALRQDPSLRDLTRTPLMLSLLTLTYHGLPVEDLFRTASPLARQRQIFAQYVQRMLTRQGVPARFTPAQTMHWLSWLARQMKQRNQTIFYIEQLQPNALPNQRWYRFYHGITNGLVVGMLIGLIGILGGIFLGIVGIVTPQSVADYLSPVLSLLIAKIVIVFLAVAAVLGSLTGLLTGLLSKDNMEIKAEIKPVEVISWSARHILGQGITTFIIGLFCALVTRFVIRFIPDGMPDLLNTVLSYMLVGGLLGTGRLVISQVKTRKGERKSSGQEWRHPLLDGVALGLALLLGTVLASMVIDSDLFRTHWNQWLQTLAQSLPDEQVVRLDNFFLWLDARQPHVPPALPLTLAARVARFEFPIDCLDAFSVFLTGGMSGLLIGLVYGIIRGYSPTMLDWQQRIKPNQGIWNSLRNGIRVSIVCWLLFSSLLGLVGFLSAQTFWASFLTVFIGLYIGILFGLLPNGGLACIRHLVVRFLLQRAGVAPWNYPRFLDEAAGRLLLSKVGGGYIFVHRLLLEYFAALPDADPASLRVPAFKCKSSVE